MIWVPAITRNEVFIASVDGRQYTLARGEDKGRWWLRCNLVVIAERLPAEVEVAKVWAKERIEAHGEKQGRMQQAMGWGG